jgi:hypothetical protein
MTGTILALDLGKSKGVARAYDRPQADPAAAEAPPSSQGDLSGRGDLTAPGKRAAFLFMPRTRRPASRRRPKSPWC